MFLSAKQVYSIDMHWNEIKGAFSFFTSEEYKEIEIYEKSTHGFVIDTFIKSMKILIPAILIGFLGGILKGIFDFRTRTKKWNLAGKPATWLSLSIPDLFFIVVIQFFLIFLYNTEIIKEVHLIGDEYLQNYIYCTIFLSIYPFFYSARVTYITLESEMGFDYIRTAKSKGSSNNKIIFTHVLKNAMPVIFSHLDTVTLYVLSNLFIVELMTMFRGAAFYFFRFVAPPESFYVGHDPQIYLAPALLYTICFSIIIFTSRFLSKVSAEMMTPHQKGEKG
ncbi:hypothetical protein GCM10008967_35600 [Bacillus carboniphilus]|uniref:ABC transmembrane type-1 domain-containing protein n=1 Tax=Bacillus carboniphilus TaxID=86663 RepID=A0ABN0WMN0_9BACI